MDKINNKKLYVGNLDWNVTDDDLLALFSKVGDVSSAKIILSRDTGRSRGFGFVEMDKEIDVKAAIENLNGEYVSGRPIVVKGALPEGNKNENDFIKNVRNFIRNALGGEKMRLTNVFGEFTITKEK
jgi:RNA recognition motif-containing protein